MQLGLVLRVFNDVSSLDDALKEAADLGYESIEIELDAKTNQFGVKFDVDYILEGNNAQMIRNKVGEHDLTISAIGNHAAGQLVLGPYNEDTDHIYLGSPEDKAKYGIEQMKKTAQAANELGVSIVVGFCGCADYSKRNYWPAKHDAWEKMERNFIKRWGEILETFAKFGVKFAHECHPNQFVYNIETALRAVELMDKEGHEWYFNLDPANLMLVGTDPVLFVHELGDRIIHVHAKDGEELPYYLRPSPKKLAGYPNLGFRHRIPGWGVVPWKKLITELSLSGYDNVLSVEHEDPIIERRDGVRKAIDYLKPLLIEKFTEMPWW